MEMRVEITSGPRAIAFFIGAVVLLIAACLFVAAPLLDQLLTPVSDDRCLRLGSGEPDREDPDCYGGWSGINEVEAWDRAHPSP